MSRQTTLQDLINEYAIVAGQLSTDGIHIEPKQFIMTDVMDEDYPYEVVRTFLDNYYCLDELESILKRVYG
ncbi:hypothetical protein BK143_01135 [Paenibacillus peoriae]|uniref:hypothetical protein n=1 Tax=Paenibacillus peoriae TaxID=59893 RepID=UPI00096F1FC0|nr:hypothetical protein [Paenibacillus peoriae]OMF75018.1 hypothetical protein BK143_01135 [Paenibacillus peoriae]